MVTGKPGRYAAPPAVPKLAPVLNLDLFSGGAFSVASLSEDD